MLPLEELKELESQIDAAAGIESLKPIYDRLAEIARDYTSDFEFQLAVAEVRQKVIEKGVALRRAHPNGEPPERARAAGRTAEPGPTRSQIVDLPPVQKPPPKPASKPTRSAESPSPPPGPPRLGLGIALGIAATLIFFVVIVQIARNRNLPKPAPPPPSATAAAPGTVPVDIITAPPGASIQINGDTKCRSNCRVNLAPGNYQVTAVLEGFDPAATGVTVAPGNPINVSLKLIAQSQMVRVFTDLDSGRVILDGKPAGELQDGQLVLERVPNGKHTLFVTGKNRDAMFSFEGVSGKEPKITGPVSATNMLAVLVTSLGNQASVESSSKTPVKVALNGQPRGEAGPQGLELKDVPGGDQTLTVGDGQDQRKLVVSFGAMPVVTAFLKSDINSGTLVVSTGEDDVTVFLNGKEYRHKTRRGELRIQTVGDQEVRVSKPGFQPEADQRVNVKKGEETRVAFHLRPLPKVASLQIRNGVAGTEILIDDRPAGHIAGDGSLSAANLPPGEHAIEARRDGFIARRILRTLKPGETLTIAGSELAQPAAFASLRISASPPDAAITYRRTDEAETHTAREGTLRLDPGTYVLVARAPNFVDRTEHVTLNAGESRTLDIALARESRPSEFAKPRPAPALNWAGWQRENGEYVRKGGDRVVLHSGSLAGTFTFTARLLKGGGLFRGGKLRWFVEDGEGTTQFEVDKKKFQARGPEGSRSRDHSRDREEQDERTYTIQIEITPDHIVHRMKIGDTWKTMDTQPAAGVSDGRFGFIIPGNDEVAISNLRFTPN
jgi:hypothetical protein